MPFLFVLPSLASANIVSSSRSNWSAGRTSVTKTASVSPAFQNLCELPAGTITVSPGPATISSPSSLKVTVPDSISKRSVWYGCMCAAATKPFGWTVHSTRTYSPPVSRDVSRKSRRSPVTGFSITSPLRII